MAPTQPAASAAQEPRGWAVGCAAVIAVAVAAAYANSLSGPFVFDDLPTIAGNPTIRHLWRALRPPVGRGLTVEGRPLVNLSLAFNYAISGLAPWSYHLTNLLIHVLAALTLFGLLRRILRRGCDRSPNPTAASLAACAAALLWALHPLQTEAVTYIVQRAESLMGLFYLLTLCFFLRGAEAQEVGGRGRAWLAASWLACLGGMATKEVMVTAPLMVVLFDRTFVAGSFAEGWRRHGRAYLALGSTWLLLAWEVASAGSRGGTAGLGVGVSAWSYGLTQFRAVARYLLLTFWPRTLVIDYGTFWVRSAADVLPYAALVIPLAAATVWAVLRPGPIGSARRALGFAGAWFFGILAPTSLTPGTIQMVVEHRMYLPLAAAAAVAALAGLAWSERGGGGSVPAGRFPAPRLRLFALLTLAVAVALGLRTAWRNRDYRTTLALWESSVAGAPANARGHCNLGDARLSLGDSFGALAEFREALRLQPDSEAALNGIGAADFQLGRVAEAIDRYRAAVRIAPGSAGIHRNLGDALVRAGRLAEGLAEFRESLRLDPEAAETHYSYGIALARQGRMPGAIAEFREAVRLSPEYGAAHSDLGTALMRSGQPAEALEEYRAALGTGYVSALFFYNYGNALVGFGSLQDALGLYRRALALDPNQAGVHCNLAVVLFRLRRLPEAMAEYQAALRLDPGLGPARAGLNQVEAILGRNSG